MLYPYLPEKIVQKTEGIFNTYSNSLSRPCLLDFGFQLVLVRNNRSKKCGRTLGLVWLKLSIKGQIISKCVFGVIVWTKAPTKFFPGFLP